LKEDRIKRGIPLIETMHNWENDLRSAKLPTEMRYEKVKHKAKLLEKKAHDKEQLKATANFNIEE